LILLKVITQNHAQLQQICLLFIKIQGKNLFQCFFSFRYLPYKIVTASENAQCLYWYAESGKSAVTVQRNYRLIYRKTPPSAKSINNWCEKFLKAGSVLDSKRLCCSSTSDDTEHCQSSRIFHATF
jgi:hypothetical protein